jgi:hypothetical protein
MTARLKQIAASCNAVVSQRLTDHPHRPERAERVARARYQEIRRAYLPG